MFATVCCKFIQNIVYQILSESAEICRRYDKNILAYFFLGHGVVFFLFVTCGISLPPPRSYVRPGICLSVCLLATLGKNYWTTWKFYHKCNFGQGSLHYILDVIQIWRPDPYPDAGSLLWIRTRYVFAEVCAVRVLLLSLCCSRW